MALRRLVAFLLLSACTPESPAQSPPPEVPGELPFQYINHIFLTVTLNDSLEAVLLYDPIRGIILDERFTRRSQLPTYGGEDVGYGGPVYAGGAGSQQHVVTFARDLHLQNSAADGTIDRAFPLTPVIPLDSMMAVSLGRRVDGLFGIDILADHVLEFDFDRERFVLHDTTRFAPPEGAVGLPITPMGRDGKPTVPVTVHLASGDTVDGQFVLDFGMGGVLRLTTAFTDAHGLTERIGPTTSGSESGLGGALESRIGRVPAVSMGALQIEAPVLSLARETEGADANPPWDGLIGLGLLERYRVFYDAPGDHLWLLPTERSADPFVYARSGLGWEPIDQPGGGLVVRTVRGGSAAASAGLLPGDRLVAVEGEDASDWTRRAWSRAVDAAAHGDRPLVLRIVRQSQQRTLHLHVEELL